MVVPCFSRVNEHVNIVLFPKNKSNQKKLAHHNFAELTVRSAKFDKNKNTFPVPKTAMGIVLLTDRFKVQFCVVFILMENSNPAYKNVQCTQCPQCPQLLIRPLQNS